MKTHPRSTRRLLAPLVACAALLLAGCGGTSSAEEDADPAASEATPNPAFPRTIQTDHGEVTIESEPQRIVAGSLNAAETVMALGETDRLAALPEIAQQGQFTTFREQADEVSNALPGGFADDPEQILALEPDLVLITLAHDGEEDVYTMLTEAGVPVVATDYPATMDEAIEGIRTIGEAIGSDEAAEAHIDQIEERAAAVDKLVAESTEEPRVLYVSMWLDDGPYGTGPGTLTHDLLLRAGATNALEEAGFEASDYVDVEQIVAAAPTHIITQDPEGVGLDIAGGFLDHPGLADVPAIADDRILVLPNGYFSPSIGGIDALEQMAAWLADPDATTEVQ